MSLEEKTKKYTRHFQNQKTLAGGMRKVKQRLVPEKYLTPLKAHIIFSCFNCVRCDPYSLCSHKCLYCYSLDKTASLFPNLYDNFVPDLIREADIGQVKENFYEAFNRNTRGDTLVNFLRKKTPIHMSDLTDAFQPKEKELYDKRKSAPTLECLDIFKEYEQPLIISTKSALPAEEPWFSRIMDLKPFGLIVQSSITTLDVGKAKKLESGASSPLERLAMLKKFHDAGVRTAIRISPVIPKITHMDYKLIVDASTKMEASDVYLLAMMFISGNKDVSNGLQKAFGIDMLKYYKSLPNLYAYGCQYNLQYPLIKEMLFPIRDYAHEHDLPVNFDMPPGMYPLSDEFHCCGGDGIFKHTQLNILGQRGLSRFIIDNRGDWTFSEVLNLVEHDLVSVEHKTAFKDMWENLLWQMVGVQYVGNDSTGMPIYSGCNPEDDPKLNKLMSREK